MTDIIKKMIEEASKVLVKAYAPYSRFTVASCICTTNNKLYTGVNIENGSYGLSLCAEACAICNMIISGEKKIKAMVILAGSNELCPPCGACRQRIHEFSSTETMIYLCNKDKILKNLPINELLPLAFNFNPE